MAATWQRTRSLSKQALLKLKKLDYQVHIQYSSKVVPNNFTKKFNGSHIMEPKSYLNFPRYFLWMVTKQIMFYFNLWRKKMSPSLKDAFKNASFGWLPTCRESGFLGCATSKSMWSQWVENYYRSFKWSLARKIGSGIVRLANPTKTQGLIFYWLFLCWIGV